MTWVKLDDKRALNKKLRAVGFAARGLDEAAICWSAHEELDGFISDDDVAMLATLHGCKKVQPLIDLLVKENRWVRWEDPGGYEIVDFLKYNPSKADLEAGREKDRKRKRDRLGTTTESGGIPDGIRVVS